MGVTDVCGPMEVKSFNGSLSFVTLIDDVFRKQQIYTIKNKSDVFDIFKIFHVLVEREIEKPIKCLKSNNGGEYCSNKFVEYCRKHGIKHEKTVPQIPQQN